MCAEGELNMQLICKWEVTLGNVCEHTATLTLNLIFYLLKEKFKGLQDDFP